MGKLQGRQSGADILIIRVESGDALPFLAGGSALAGLTQALAPAKTHGANKTVIPFATQVDGFQNLQSERCLSAF
jgi:hypothetical protein